MEYMIERVNESGDDILEHHGILGMKWGIRRYQNKDGSLTDKGQTHRTLREKIHDYKVTKKRAENLKKAREARAKKKEEEAKQAEEMTKRKEAIRKGQINYKDMTDDEIYERINRLSNEKRLRELEENLIALNAPKEKESKIKELGKKALDDAVVPALTSAGKMFIEKEAKKLLGLDTKEVKTAYQLLKEEAEMSKWRKQILDDKHDMIGINKKIKDIKDADKQEEAKLRAEAEKRQVREKEAEAIRSTAEAAKKVVDAYNERWMRGESDDRVTPSGINAAGRRETIRPKLLGNNTRTERAYDWEVVGEGNGYRTVYNMYPNPITSVSREVRNSGYERTTKLLEGPTGSTSLSIINRK